MTAVVGLSLRFDVELKFFQYEFSKNVFQNVCFLNFLVSLFLKNILFKKHMRYSQSLSALKTIN